MKTQIQQPKQASRTLQNKTKAANQAPMSQILQTYSERNIQRQTDIDEDELLQGKFETAQREEFDEDELLQGKFDVSQQQSESPPLGGGGANNIGLPDNLKAGIENLSGYSMDDVQVHYNSPKPAQLQALAYTQGSDIHVAPGQERHLPHEAWHVVQQKQGRVQPTMQLQGVNINDNEGLEKEADVMGNMIYKNANFNKIKHTGGTQVVRTFCSTTQSKDIEREQLTTPFTDRYSSNVAQREPTHLEKMTLGNYSYNILDYLLKQIFRGDGAVRVNALSDDKKIAHMGWDSILKFKIRDRKFIQFETIIQMIGTGINTKESEKTDSIITRGVDTCTVIFITDGSIGTSAHLDAGKLVRSSLSSIARSVPKTMCKQGENPITAVFSLIDDRKSPEPTDKFSRAGFVRELISYYFVRDRTLPKENGNVDLGKEEDLISELKKGTHLNDSIEIINRGSTKSDKSKIIIHPEIGFTFDKDSLVIFYTYTERSHKDSIKKLSECEFKPSTGASL